MSKMKSWLMDCEEKFYDEVAKVIGWSGEFIYDLSRPVGMNQKLCDTSCADKWGWRAQTTLAVGIEKTYKFYLERCVK